MDKPSSRVVGSAGETRARAFLEQNGYEIVAANWRTKRGEIDIIASINSVIVFCEVKTIPSGEIRTLEHVLGKIKQKKIIETAKCFLSMYRQYNDSIIRFDVLVVDMPGWSPIYHIENAFSEHI